MTDILYIAAGAGLFALGAYNLTQEDGEDRIGDLDDMNMMLQNDKLTVKYTPHGTGLQTGDFFNRILEG